jgi:hexosaminidase
MSWRGEAGGLTAAGLGHDVIMTPNSYCYWDYYQATDVENEPFAIGGYVPVELMYSYEPYPADMQEEERSRILGVQANMWTEYIATPEHLEYMLLPRLAALSEVQWCEPENKDWKRFLGSMDELCAAYERMGYNYAEHIFGVRGYVEADRAKGCAKVTLETQDDAPIRYTTDGSDPCLDSRLYEGPFEISETCVLKASAVRDGVLTRPYVKTFSFHKAVGKDIVLTHPSESEFPSDGGRELLDGIRGPAIHKSKEWASWKAKPFEAVIDMDGSQPYSRVEVGYISNKPSQIFNPVALSVCTSDDGLSWTEVVSVSIPAEGEFDPDGLKSTSVSFAETSARYMKVKAECLSNVPAWHHYPGRQAWLYIDEIVVE